MDVDGRVRVWRGMPIPYGVSGQSWFLCSNIESLRRGLSDPQGRRDMYEKGAEIGCSWTYRSRWKRSQEA